MWFSCFPPQFVVCTSLTLQRNVWRRKVWAGPPTCEIPAQCQDDSQLWCQSIPTCWWSAFVDTLESWTCPLMAWWRKRSQCLIFECCVGKQSCVELEQAGRICTLVNLHAGLTSDGHWECQHITGTCWHPLACTFAWCWRDRPQPEKVHQVCVSSTTEPSLWH